MTPQQPDEDRSKNTPIRPTKLSSGLQATEIANVFSVLRAYRKPTFRIEIADLTYVSLARG
jgi:hypothetical protein